MTRAEGALRNSPYRSVYRIRGKLVLQKMGSMSIVGVEQKEEPKKRSSVGRHITPFIRCHEAQ